jgi:mannose-6-phosphate isomerase-like protein (cupin superfamily)
VSDGYAVIIPAGTNHNVINTSETEDLKLYTIYSPANHPDGTIHATKEEADLYEEAHHQE